MSRQHAILLRVPSKHGYQYRLVDGNTDGKRSANGIFVNGQRITSHELKNGDSVAFGSKVKAAYLALSMGEVELMDYLESISYQSLKLKVLDSKETIVGEDIDNYKKASFTALKEPEKVNSSQSDLPVWITTLNESEIPSETSSNASDRPFKRNLSLLIGAVGSMLGIALLGFGLYGLRSLKDDDAETSSRQFSLSMLAYNW